MSLNLISVGQLCDLGLTVIFSPLVIRYMIRKRGRFLGPVAKWDNYLSSPLFIIKGLAATTSSSSLYQWHLYLKIKELTPNSSFFSLFKIIFIKIKYYSVFHHVIPIYLNEWLPVGIISMDVIPSCNENLSRSFNFRKREPNRS